MSAPRVVVVGGGPAGLMAAGTAASRGAQVVLLEKMERVGKKLGITGKGRCNLTNLKDWDAFSAHVHPNARYVKPAFYAFPSAATVAFFNRLGVPTVVEHGDRVFPASYKASDIVNALEQWVRAQGVRVICNYTQPLTWSTLSALGDYVILATGGQSYPSTGSTGDGYALAQETGHTLVPVFPVLTALHPRDYDHDLEGIALKNCTLDLYINGTRKQSEMGELQFTHLGIEGALGFRLSRKAVVALREGQQVEVQLDLKPALTQAQLLARWDREKAAYKERLGGARFDLERFVAQNLKGYLPLALIKPFRAYVQRARCHEVEALKCWRMPIDHYGDWARAVVTAGGVSFKDVNAKTMQSRIVPNLYFAGEVLDMDANSGGYNLQLAFSTGYLAGLLG